MLSRTQTSAVSKHANKTGHYPLSDEGKFIDRQDDNRPLQQRTAEGSVSSSHNANNALDRNPPARFVIYQSLTTTVSGGSRGRARPALIFRPN